jgi:hypothetical protein
MQRIESYSDSLSEHAVWDKMMRGLSTRDYGAVVKEFREAYGVEKSTVSDSFIAASREKLQALMERPLGELRLCAVLIDGTPFRDRQMIVALEVSMDGRGLAQWQGARGAWDCLSTRVDEVKTAESRRHMSIHACLLNVLKAWKQTTQFPNREDWMFASPVRLARLPWSYDQIWRVY